jgi:hypothetical protein
VAAIIVPAKAEAAKSVVPNFLIIPSRRNDYVSEWQRSTIQDQQKISIMFRNCSIFYS